MQRTNHHLGIFIIIQCPVQRDLHICILLAQNITVMSRRKQVSKSFTNNTTYHVTVPKILHLPQKKTRSPSPNQQLFISCCVCPLERKKTTIGKSTKRGSVVGTRPLPYHNSKSNVFLWSLQLFYTESKITNQVTRFLSVEGKIVND